jgi:predicted O-methyltransferase YrrM
VPGRTSPPFGLAELTELREGDALQTLARDLPDRIDLARRDATPPKGLAAILTLLKEPLTPALLIAAHVDNSPSTSSASDHPPADTSRCRAPTTNC